MREEIQLVPVGEAELYVEDVGAKDAPTLVTVHGGPGGSSAPLRAGLGEELADYRVIYYDQRGSGRSPALPEDPRLFTIDALVEDMEDLRQALGVERWTPLAHGFGAVVALEYARRFPLHVDGLVLIGPWVHFPWLVKRMWRVVFEADPPEDPTQAVEELFEYATPKEIFDRLMFPTAHGRMQKEWLEDGAQLAPDDRVLRLFAYNGLFAFDYVPYLVEHPHRPFVLVGDGDGTSHPEQAQAVTDLTGGTPFVIPGAGHYPWIDAPEPFLEGLYEALDTIHAFTEGS